MRPLLAAALLAAAAAPLSAQTIIGRVVERGTDRPLGSVQVALRDSRDVVALRLIKGKLTLAWADHRARR